MSIVVEPARPEELAPAFRLIFQHLTGQDRNMRVANALELVRKNALDATGVLVARRGPAMLGAMICSPAPGAGGIVWPPQTAGGPRRREVEDVLMSRATVWLRQRGAKMAQSLLAQQELSQSPPLERNGFPHVTSLWYMRHGLELSAALLHADQHFDYQTYASADKQLFHQTLLRTYEKTRDCPEVNGVRTIEEVIEGHRSQGVHDPGRWWLAWHAGRPVGVLLLTEMPEWDSWDIAYLGVVADARGRGFGRELTLKAVYEAKAAEQRQLTLAVDARNKPAYQLYRAVGFEPYDQREVFLAVWR